MSIYPFMCRITFFCTFYRNSVQEFPISYIVFEIYFHLKIKAEFEKVFLTKVLNNEKLYNFHVLGKTQFGLYRAQIPF